MLFIFLLSTLELIVGVLDVDQPVSFPTGQPTRQPSAQPSMQPSSLPSSRTVFPSEHPSPQPTAESYVQDVDLSTLIGPAGFAIYGGAGGDQSGWSVSDAGDVDGDGVNDVIVGARYVGPPTTPARAKSGVSYVIFGRSSAHSAPYAGLNLLSLNSAGSAFGFAIFGAAGIDSSGWSVSRAGDVNNDGLADVIVGAVFADPPARGNGGIVYVIFGRSSVNSPTTYYQNIDLLPLNTVGSVLGFAILGAGPDDRAGASVSGAGDVNGDGVDDVIIGANLADPGTPARSNAGASYVVFGRSKSSYPTTYYQNVNLQLFHTAGSSTGFAILGASPGDYCGYDVSGAGDVNGDGLADVVIGAYTADPAVNPVRTDAGMSYVIFGRRKSVDNTYYANIDLLSLNSVGSALGFAILGAVADDRSGCAVSGAGDVNDDGLADVIIGAFNADPGTPSRSNAGASYVIFGRNKTTSSINSYTNIDLLSLSTVGSALGFAILGAVSLDSSGYAVSGTGDVNGDGVADVIVGAPNADPPSRGNAGISYVVYGRRTNNGVANSYANIELANLPITRGFRILGAVAGESSGNSVSAVGDVNGDGLDDVIVGAYNAFSSAGASYVISGALSSPTSTPSSQPSSKPSGQPSTQPSAQPVFPSGQPSSQPLGMPTSQPSMQPSSSPSAQPTRHPSTEHDVDLGVLPDNSGFSINGGASGDWSGYSVSGAGDVDGDGIDDVIVGANYASPATTPVRGGAGISYVIFGRSHFGNTSYEDINMSMLKTAGSSLGFAILGAVAGDRSGFSVSGAGDVNGDGLDDVIVGAWQASPLGIPPRGGAGISYVIFGRNKAANITASHTNIDLLPLNTAGSVLGFAILGAAAGDGSGFRVRGAGDVNGDGLADVIVGAYRADPGIPARGDAGVTNIVFGRRKSSDAIYYTNVDLLPLHTAGSVLGFAILGAVAGDRCGYSVSGAGDVNGDGLADVITGAYRANPGSPPRTQAGVCYVLFGRRKTANSSYYTNIDLLPLNTAGDITGYAIVGAVASDFVGSAVSAAGDVNGDGLADVIVGAYGADPGTPAKDSAGISYVIFGRNKTLSAVASFANVYLLQLNSAGSFLGFAILGAKAGDWSGYSVSCAGDINGDGVDDIMIGAYYSDPGTPPRNNAGISYVVYGRRWSNETENFFTNIDLGALVPVLGYRIIGAVVNGFVGNFGGTAGDVNMDGVDDMIVAAYGAYASAGVVYVVFGTSSSINQPSAQPSGQPSTQPSAQPVSVPSAFPSVQPSSQPVGVPSRQPSNQPSSAPTAQPSEKPLSQPTAQPSLQPWTAPSGLPSSAPSVRPTLAPTGEWATVVPALLLTVVYPNSFVWACGEENSTVCVLADVGTGDVVSEFYFDWTSVSNVLRTSNAGSVIITGLYSMDSGTVASEVAACSITQEVLNCISKTYHDATFLAASYVPYPNKMVYIGWANVHTSISILDVRSGEVVSYIYTAANTNLLRLSHIHSLPASVSSFVAGTAIRATSSAVNYIIAGMLRTDGGNLKVMALMPEAGDILNSADLVNAMVLEIDGTDLFIAGSMQFVGASANAYMLRANALYMDVQYCVCYRTSSDSRRALTGAPISSSVVRGMVLVDTTLFMIVDHTSNNVTALTVLKTDFANGEITTQVHVTAPNVSLYCNGITAVDLHLSVVCYMRRADNRLQSVMILVNQALSFAALPVGFVRSEEEIFQAETVLLQRKMLTITQTKAAFTTSTTEFNTDNQGPTRRLSLAPSYPPSSPPSKAPAAQPSSSPTAEPTVSACPTSHPSSAVPTTSHKPTAEPTKAPSKKPTYAPTHHPSTCPTKVPTVRPTAHPSVLLSERPSPTPTPHPTRLPSAKRTRKPSKNPTEVPSSTPSVMPTNQHDIGNQSLSSDVVGVSVGGGLVVLLVCCGLYQYCKYCQMKKAKNLRFVAYMKEQTILAEKASAELAKYIQEQDDRQTAFRQQQREEREEKKLARKRRQEERKAKTAANKSRGAYAIGPVLCSRSPPTLPVQEPSEASSSEYDISTLHSSERSSALFNVTHRTQSGSNGAGGRKATREDEFFVPSSDSTHSSDSSCEISSVSSV